MILRQYKWILGSTSIAFSPP